MKSYSATLSFLSSLSVRILLHCEYIGSTIKILTSYPILTWVPYPPHHRPLVMSITATDALSARTFHARPFSQSRMGNPSAVTAAMRLPTMLPLLKSCCVLVATRDLRQEARAERCVNAVCKCELSYAASRGGSWWVSDGKSERASPVWLPHSVSHPDGLGKACPSVTFFHSLK